MRTLIALIALSATGCVAAVGTQGMVTVPKDSPHTCTRFCNEMGLTLSAVVVMASNVGCVCTPPIAVSTTQGAAATAGMATIAMQDEEHRKQQR